MEKLLKEWDLKDRTYKLREGLSPLTYRLSASGIPYFDEEIRQNRQLRYSPNQKSLFADEQDNHVIMSHVVFERGMLHVPKTEPLLQILLSKFHPQRGNLFHEVDEVKKKIDELEQMDIIFEAEKLARELDFDHLEAIMRTELGRDVNDMTSKELRHDAILFARNNPSLFMELANDEDLKLRNLANVAVEQGIIALTDDNSIFRWKSNKRKIMSVPFEDNPYGAFAKFLKTDDGADVMASLLKKIG